MLFGILFGVFAALSYALSNIFTKKLSMRGNPLLGTLFITFFLSFISLIIVLFTEGLSLISPLSLLVVSVQGLLGALGFLALLKSFTKLSIGETIAIGNLNPFLILILASIFGFSKISLGNMGIMLVVFVGILFLTFDNWTVSPYLLLAFVVSFTWAGYGLGINYLLSAGTSIYTSIFYLETSIFLFTALIYLIKFGFTFPDIDFKFIKDSFLSGFITIIGAVLFALSISKIPVSIAASILSSQVAFSSIIGYICFKEKIGIQKIIGIIIISLALILFKLVN